eukprot:TRINITY_DN55291_c0_g1_i1.p1 TRINITY_DN55291_c0_g1~~TRINITY_DN55291_c0_g1_i1.p1  ORF type:complete len:422 (-),score=83.99 TRINITY_DN55291_c0_g1_i1:44-1228(-)
MPAWKNGGDGIELFLKFLPYSATEDTVRAHYKKAAPSMTKVRLSINKATGECKGIGWLTVTDEADATRLLTEWNQEPQSLMDDRHVDISRSVQLDDIVKAGSWQGDGQRSKQAGGRGFECRFGSACKRADCTFSHPPGWSAEWNAGEGRFQRPCKYGAICGRSDCLFQHPETWNPDKVVTSGRLRNCKLGWDCAFKACFYHHPEGRAIDDEAEKPKDDVEQLHSKSFKLRRQDEKELLRQAAELDEATAESETSKTVKMQAEEKDENEAEVEVSKAPQKRKKRRELESEVNVVEDADSKLVRKQKSNKSVAEAAEEETQVRSTTTKKKRKHKGPVPEVATSAEETEKKAIERKKRRANPAEESDVDSEEIKARTKANRLARKKKKLSAALQKAT